MIGWDSFSCGLYGLLNNKARLQKVLNYRRSVGPFKEKRRRLMVKSMGVAAWEELLMAFAGFSDTQLQTSLKYTEDELDLRLQRKFEHY